MAKGAIHQLAGAAAGIGICLKNNEDRPDEQCDLMLAGLLGGALGKLPDRLEPAIHPNHRQFFHSVAVFIACTYGVKKLFDWEPDTQEMVWLRRLLLVGGAAYLSHLLLDGMTPKSLPLIGKL
jgi:inner membrane protein